MPEINVSEWDNFLSRHPDAHLLQTSAWGELKSAFSWEPVRIRTGNTGHEAGAFGAQVLFRKLIFGLRLAYIARGPVGGEEQAASYADWETLWSEVDTACRLRQAVFLKVEPDMSIVTQPQSQTFSLISSGVPPGFIESQHSIQPPRTLMVDLCGDEEHVLARMKQKTRYNVRLALKKGVVVSPSSDLETFYKLMVTTGQREAFGIHTLEYYRRAYELFHSRQQCELLLAEYRGQPLAGLMVFAHGKRAWYFYGASADEHRELMSTYLLQWEAMRWARARDCTLYDLWGVPDADENVLEAQFAEQTGGLWGVYRFKRGFGGQLVRAPGTWDRVYRPVLYSFYRWWVRKSPSAI